MRHARCVGPAGKGAPRGGSESLYGSARFVGRFGVGFRVGLRARDFPTERVLSRTPLIIRTVDQKEHASCGIIVVMVEFLESRKIKIK